MVRIWLLNLQYWLLLLLPVHRREEVAEEGVHGRHPAGDADVVTEYEPARGRHKARHQHEQRRPALLWICQILSMHRPVGNRARVFHKIRITPFQ